MERLSFHLALKSLMRTWNELFGNDDEQEMGGNSAALDWSEMLTCLF